MRETIVAIAERLTRGDDLVVTTIVRHEGSTPREAGAKMAVNRDGLCAGTIGGGAAEGAVIARAGELLNSGKPELLTFSLRPEEEGSLGAVCGGAVEVLLDPVPATPENAGWFRAWAEGATRPGTWAVIGLPAADAPQVRALYREGGVFAHTGPPLPLAAIRALEDMPRGRRHAFTITADGREFLVEPSARPGTVILFGAGHVAVPTAHLAQMMGFSTIVLDDRAEFANRNRFPEVDEVRVVADFTNCVKDLAVDEDAYLVIVTRGHEYDREVLAQSLGTRAGYIGMIGSRRKKAAVYQALRNDGFTDAYLERVHCPIGLSIGAQSPEEIAVSIVGELIQERASRET